MKPLTLNISKMKKISSDDHSTTFQHPEGHMMKIAHKSLSPLHRKQIENLPVQKFDEGGEAEPVKGRPQSYYDAIDAQDDSTPPEHAPGEIDYEKRSDASIQNQSQPSNAPMPAAIPTPEQGPGNPDDVQIKPGDLDAFKNLQMNKDTGFVANKNQYVPQSGEMPENNAEWTGSAGHLDANGNLSDQTQPDQQQVPPSEEQRTPATQQQSTLDQQLTENRIQQQKYVDQLNVSDGQFKDLLKNNKIDPNRLYKNQDTGSKIKTGIAMLLGGMSSGTLGGENPAVKYMNDSINRDIDAQKNDQSKNMNLWKMNREALHSDMAANLMTRNQMLSDAQVKMQEAGGALPGHMADQKIDLLNQQMELEKARIKSQLAMVQHPTPSGDPAKDLYNRHAMGLIDKEQYAQGNKELSAAQEAINLKTGLHESYDDLNGKLLAGAFSPEDRASAVNFLAGRLGKVSEGRYNEEAAKKQIEAIMPAKFEASDTRANKLRRMDQLVDSQISTPTLDGMNISIPGAPIHGQTPATQQIKIGADGRKYIQQGKYMVPIK